MLRRWLFPLPPLKMTDKQVRCINLASYNYLGFGGVDEYCTPRVYQAIVERRQECHLLDHCRDLIGRRIAGVASGTQV